MGPLRQSAKEGVNPEGSSPPSPRTGPQSGLPGEDAALVRFAEVLCPQNLLEGRAPGCRSAAHLRVRCSNVRQSGGGGGAGGVPGRPPGATRPPGLSLQRPLLTQFSTPPADAGESSRMPTQAMEDEFGAGRHSAPARLFCAHEAGMKAAPGLAHTEDACGRWGDAPGGCIHPWGS